eukprot:TRINITY_DN6339_c0_g1_i1.p1 TRINITY_DN6339_c0_g1~~TRINITY_DN6339_c0_g1_i1.p1  ORF type:complete len:1198 (+),score=452.68 TRINITY_DN6339_c0_g1_i1:81-3674(+)
MSACCLPVALSVVHDNVLVASASGKVLAVNSCAATQFALPVDGVEGGDIFALTGIVRAEWKQWVLRLTNARGPLAITWVNTCIQASQETFTGHIIREVKCECSCTQDHYIVICRTDSGRAEVETQHSQVYGRTRPTTASVTMDESSIIVGFDRGAENLWGWKADEVVGKRIEMLMPNSFADGHAAHTRSALMLPPLRKQCSGAKAQRNNVKQNRRLIATLRSGAEVCVSVSVVEEGSAEGEPRVFKANVRLITGEEEEERLKRIYESIVRSAADAIIVVNEHSMVVEFNPAAEKMLGYTQREMIGKCMDILLPDDVVAHHAGYIRKLVEECTEEAAPDFARALEPFTARMVQAKKKDGTLVDVSISISEVPMEHTDDRKFAAFLRDISATVHNIEALKQEALQLTRTRDELEAASNLKDAFLANTSHELRTPLHAIIGMTELMKQQLEANKDEIASILPNMPIDLDTIDASAWEVLAHVTDLLDYSRLKHDREGFCGSLALKAVDVKELIERAVRTTTHLLAPGVDVRLHLPDRVPCVYADPRRLLQVLINLLSNAMKFTSEGSITISVRHEPGSELRGDGVSDEEELGEDEEEREGAHENDEDEHHLARTQRPSSCPGESPQDELASSTARDRNAPRLDGHMVIAVQDAGIGIASHQLPHIFDPFVQWNTESSERESGLGLGLAITKELVEVQGGTIHATSIEGCGSRFFFTVPVVADDGVPKDAADPADRLRLTVSERRHSCQSLRSNPSVEQRRGSNNSEEVVVVNKEEDYPEMSQRPYILVVDDSKTSCLILKRTLTSHNMIVHVAHNGIDGLAMIEKMRDGANSRFDLVLLDVMMPQIDGYTVCERIREQFTPNSLPVILLTAKARVPDIVRGFTAQANDYLMKPFNTMELLARIRSHVRLSRIHASYERFVPHEFLTLLGKEDITMVRVGDKKTLHMGVMFADIRNFTHISEKLGNDRTFELLNGLFDQFGPVIRSFGGFVDKYIGDALMVLFPEVGMNMVHCVCAMYDTLAEFNRLRRDEYGDIRMGAGLHSGTLVLGTVGEARRMDTTVISDTVNVASRIEGVTKVFTTNALMSSALYEELLGKQESDEERAVLRSLVRQIGSVHLKGKAQQLHLFELLIALDEEERTAKLAVPFGELFQVLEEGNSEAVTAFLDSLVACYPTDSVLGYYHRAVKSGVHIGLACIKDVE